MFNFKFQPSKFIIPLLKNGMPRIMNGMNQYRREFVMPRIMNGLNWYIREFKLSGVEFWFQKRRTKESRAEQLLIECA